MEFGYLRSLAVENLNLKLLSLAFALVFYAWVHGSQETQRSLNLNVESPPTDSSSRVLTTPIPPTLRVTVRGPKSTLDDLRAEDIGSVQLDLHDGNETRVTFDPSTIPVPPGLKVEQ